MKKKIGLIGAGLMGHPMGLNWLKKGFKLTVLTHRNPEKVDDLVHKGARKVSSLRDLCEASEVVFLMLPTSREVEDITLKQKDALINCLTPEQIVVDMTTSEPSSTEMIFSNFQAKGLRFMDAPVTGGVFGATEGNLTLFLGGPVEWHEELKETLRAISVVQKSFGPVGAGHKAKVINNLICVGNLAVYAEGLPLAMHFGLDPQLMLDTLTTGMANSRMLDYYGPQIMKRDFAPRFKLAHAYKDILIALEIAKKEGMKFPVLEAVTGQFARAVKEGYGERNISALVEMIEKDLKVKFSN